ncbi:MAG: TadE/TadG family type IV pilus assembly protein [Bacteroidota bacterium]
MKTAHRSNRGQVLIIFVFAIIGLIGITGLAVDGTHIFAERRQVQNAADTAAMAGAIVKVNGQKDNGWSNASCVTTTTSPLPACWSAIVTEAKDRAASNGYTGNLVDSTVEVYVPPISGTYSDCSSYAFDCRDYVQVIIDTNVNTYFARVLGIGQLHNHVEAVALARYHKKESLFGGNSLVVLDPHETTCNGEFTLSGSATVTLDGGGIFVNSDNSGSGCAFKYTNGCATLQLMNNANINVVGNSDTTCTTPPVNHPTWQYPYPPDPPLAAELIPPAACGQAPQPSYVDGNGFIHYQPGFYAKLPPDNNVILDSGVYCVQDVVKTTNPTTMKTVDNDLTTPGIQGGVFIYIKDGGTFNFQGGTVDIFSITDPNNPYWGFLIYVDSDYDGTHLNCVINGGADDHYSGVIYAPDCDVTINGGSSNFGLTAQVIGYRMTVTGTNALNVIYDPNLMPGIPEIRHTGLYH